MAAPRWNAYRFPPALAFLRPLVRSKAIEIANALVREGREDDEALHVAIERAKLWDKRRRRGLGEEFL